MYDADWNYTDYATLNSYAGNSSSFTFSYTKESRKAPVWFVFYVLAGNSTTQATQQNVLTLSSFTVNWSC